MKAVYVANPPAQGSRYKFVRMFAEFCDLTVAESVTAGYDFAIVRGDKSDDYKQALRHGIPYILIEHDVWSVRAGIDSDPREREMIENATCVLFTSEHHSDLAGKYAIPPHEVVYLRPLACDIDFEPLPKLPGRNIVYAGGIVASDGSDVFGYRKYAKSVFPAQMRAGWTVHVYPAWGATDRSEDYESIGCVIHEPVHQAALYRELSQYQAGFTGYAKCGPQRYIASCRPNKLWEYLAAGIPTLGYNTGTGGALFDGRWGHVARTLKDIPAASERVLEMRIPERLRTSQVIDSDREAFARLVAIIEPAAERARELRRYGPPLVYPIKLGRECTLDGTVYPIGSRVDRETARALHAAGQLEDPRLRVNLGILLGPQILAGLGQQIRGVTHPRLEDGEAVSERHEFYRVFHARLGEHALPLGESLGQRGVLLALGHDDDLLLRRRRIRGRALDDL